MSPTRGFFDKEIVAFKSKGVYCYGRVTKDPAVAERGAAASPFGGLQAHTIEVGSGKSRRLIPSDVWSFKTCTTPLSAVLATTRRGTGGESTLPCPRGDAEGTGADAEPPLDTDVVAPRPCLSQAEYLKAAKDLLALAGLPLGDQDMQVFGANLALQSELDEARRELQAAKAQLEASGEKLTALESSSQCAICLQGPSDGVQVNVALQPCGHIFCGSCAPRLRQCATCKGRITGVMTVYC